MCAKVCGGAHLGDPRRLVAADVRVARQDVVVRARRQPRVGVDDLPVLLWVEPHLLAVVQPSVRDRADVVDVEEVVPAAGGDAQALGRRRRVHVHVGARVLDELGRQEHRRQPVLDADIQVANVLGDDDARLDAERNRVHRAADQHVSVDVQHVVDVLRLLRLLDPVHDRAWLVVRWRRVGLPRAVRMLGLARQELALLAHVTVVDVHERRADAHTAVGLHLVLVARQQPRDATRHAGDVVAPEGADRLVIEVVGAFGTEDRVDAGSGRRRGRRQQKHARRVPAHHGASACMPRRGGSPPPRPELGILLSAAPPS